MEQMKSMPERRSTPERGNQPEGLPWIYVTSVADCLNSVRHSAWISADQTPEQIQAQLDTFMEASPALRSTDPGAPGWFIEEKLGFYDFAPYLGNELTEISAIGQGIAMHGEAFAAYAMEHSGGEHSERLLTEFEDFYVASFPNAKSCIDEFLDSMGWSQALAEFIAEQRIDCLLEFDRSCIWEKYTQAWEVIETRNGAVHVFNT